MALCSTINGNQDSGGHTRIRLLNFSRSIRTHSLGDARNIFPLSVGRIRRSIGRSTLGRE